MAFAERLFADVERFPEVIESLGKIAGVEICRADIVVRKSYVGVVGTDNLFLNGKSFLIVLKRFLIVAKYGLQIRYY